MPKYHMYKKEKEITDREKMIKVLRQGKFATLALSRADEPYIVTMNYGYDEAQNSLYFHCALKGLKLDFITSNPKVCATVIQDRGYKMHECSHAYRSVLFFGTIWVLTDLKEKKHGMEVLFSQLEENPDPIRARSFKTDRDYSKVNILRLDITEIMGKQGN